MKKCLFSLVVFFFTAALIHLEAQPEIGFGVRAGVNISSQSTSVRAENVQTIDLNGLLRYNGGVWFNYFIIDRLAIQPELLISGKGANWNDPDYDVKDLLTYIDVPVLIRYQIIDFLNIHAGPEFGHLLRARQKDNATGDIIGINDYYKKSDFGIAVGLEGNLPMKINVTVRYVFGLIPTTTDVQYIDPWYNNFFEISVGYRLFGK